MPRKQLLLSLLSLQVTLLENKRQQPGKVNFLSTLCSCSYYINVNSKKYIGIKVLIVKSFRGGKESPVSTSVSVLPITQITFPNLTVCPPRGTFTSLNYDILRVGNRSLEDDSELGEFIAELLAEEGYQSMLEDLENFHEKNRFRNWYEGLSQISLSYWDREDKQKEYFLDTLGRLAVNITKY